MKIHLFLKISEWTKVYIEVPKTHSFNQTHTFIIYSLCSKYMNSFQARVWRQYRIYDVLSPVELFSKMQNAIADHQIGSSTATIQMKDSSSLDT